ncbi:MAG TPA: ERF family protein [Arenicellales bacterium]|nr:ERF family protein [Arenicellales bacterium]
MSETAKELQAAREFQAPVVQEPETIMAVISRAASDPNTDAEKLDRMMQLYERLENRRSEQEFHAALAQMQVDLPEISERGEIRHNGRLISKYAKWEDVNKAIKPVLHRYGFALSFRVATDDKVLVEGVLSHRMGHCERTRITLPADVSGSKNPVQAVASSVSYGKRYVAGALLNLTSGEGDDDGQAAGGIERITEQQAADLRSLMEEVGADEVKFLKYLQAERIEAIQAAAYKDAVAALERKRKRG